MRSSPHPGPDRWKRTSAVWGLLSLLVLVPVSCQSASSDSDKPTTDTQPADGSAEKHAPEEVVATKKPAVPRIATADVPLVSPLEMLAALESAEQPASGAADNDRRIATGASMAASGAAPTANGADTESVETKPGVVEFRLGNPTIYGSLDKAIIRKFVLEHKREIKTCYREGLRKDAGLAGTVDVGFVISTAGEIVGVVVKSSTLDDPTVERCLVDEVRSWSVPKHICGGLVRVTYPFIFSAG